MVKGISSINGLIKTSVVATLLAGSSALYASNPIKDINNKPNNTEILSREGADALKAMRVNEINQTAVPTVHNKRIDDTFRKFAKDDEEKKLINSLIDGMYPTKGTFLTSALLQHELDRQQYFLLLEEKGNLLIKNNINPELGKEVSIYGSDFYKSVRPHAKEIDKWIDDEYTPRILGNLSFDHKPTAKEVIDRLDDIVENRSNFKTNEVTSYNFASDVFIKKQLNNRTDDLALSELIAFKMYMIDKTIFEKTSKNNDFFKNNGRLTDFYNEWIETVEPTGK